MSHDSRRRALEEAGLVHPRPEAVSAPLFVGGDRFFLAADKVQVKYEMLRARALEEMSVVAAAAAHGYSRAEFYLVASAFARSGMTGLLDAPRGRKGPLKLRPDIVAFVEGLGPVSGAVAADAVEARFGVRLHRRTLERAMRR